RPRFSRGALKFFPEPEGLVSRSEEQWRHQRLFVGALRHPLKTDLSKIYPSPIPFSKLGVAAGKISRLKENVGIGVQCVFRADFAQGEIGSLAKSKSAFISDHADGHAQRWNGVTLLRSII